MCRFLLLQLAGMSRRAVAQQRSVAIILVLAIVVALLPPEGQSPVYALEDSTAPTAVDVAYGTYTPSISSPAITELTFAQRTTTTEENVILSTSKGSRPPSAETPSPSAGQSLRSAQGDRYSEEPEQASLDLYLVRLREPNLLAATGAPVAELVLHARERQREELSATLDELVRSARAGAYVFDEAEGAFRIELSDSARVELMDHPLVSAVEPHPDRTSLSSSENMAMAGDTLANPLGSVGAQGVSSIIFVQVYSPFVWGRTNIGGLSVELTLENSAGITKGVASQLYPPAPEKYIKIDRTQLYFETVFVNPADGEPAIILPGDRVHIVTSGDDPATEGADPPEDKRIVVDDIRAWTSYDRDTVSGTAPPNSNLIVTAGAVSFLNLSSYLTPGSSMTYADLTAAPDGSFSVAAFRSSSDSTPRVVNMQQGSTGFVRVRHPDGNEVYTVHGQNVLVLQNSSVLHLYAFQLPWAPGSLEFGVTVNRPKPNVTATLRYSNGQIKDSTVLTAVGLPLAIEFTGATISGGDLVDISISQAPTVQVVVGPIVAQIELAANQVTGTGPANKDMVLAIGRISGYITSSSFMEYLKKQVTTNGGGAFASGQFQCGTSNYLSLQPGSFGYVGYEDWRGNFVYTSLASPTNHVMSDFHFAEGWIANGTVRPVITVRDSNGGLKHQSTEEPILFWMTNEKLFNNVYYNVTPSQYIVPGDVVTVVSGGQTFTIPVDRITANLDTDTDVIVGTAPAGSNVRVVPANDRSARREVVVDAGGTYSAGNPWVNLSNSNCSETTKTKDFIPGDAGRAYVRHADGSQVYTAYGRGMHVNQNENYLELYSYVLRDLDWWDPAPGTPRRPVTITLTPKVGSPITRQVDNDFGRPGKARFNITNDQSGRVIIRAGDTITATFQEGLAGLTRPVTFTMPSMALITGSPDIETNTLGGVGPRGWGGRATLNAPPTSKPTAIPAGSSTAYPSAPFLTSSNSIIPLVQGYSGVVSFSDTTGNRIWVAWAATAALVKIVGFLRPGNTQVCGKAPAGGTVRIHDVTSETLDIVIGTGSSNAQGTFCVPVTPLYEDQVVMAEAEGTFSQPVVVTDVFLAFLPVVTTR